MADKRSLTDSESDQDQPNDDNRKRPRPSFASVIGEVVMVNSMQNLFSSLEPLLRRVVGEEVDQVLKRCALNLTRSPSLRIQALDPSSLCLTFAKSPCPQIFTASKISDEDNNQIQILILDKNMISGSHQMAPISLPHSVKVEIVVLDGDFPSENREDWTSQEFNRNVLKERTGKRPLLTGDVNVTVRDGFATIGDIEFTDNSSWIRSRKFRLGARVAPGTGYQGPRIREAMTDSFVVKDHRGELYKKHHPPMLEDEVWRLEKIGKDGAFHRKLAAENIHTVQEFLKMLVVDRLKLKKILGIVMSEKMWEVSVKHARTCVMGNKMYIFRGPHFELFLSPICQVMKAVINGQTFHARDLNNYNNRNYIENLVRQAHANWSSLETVDTVMNETPLLTQGHVEDEQYPQAMMVRTLDHQVINDGQQQQEQQLADHKRINNVGGAGYLQNNMMMAFECSDNWQISSPYSSFSPLMDTGGIKCSNSSAASSSSDGDLGSPGL
ncbi:protein SAR DEFICIENT 1 [Argentina anserina]|uniref:protein SAR DEFICIENT 1 n=1 Tax=Argentina anserina TaxID=57926 RepID=UPI0021763BDF|nr:protein SAR DEFICIENT 1 [Potentilla anserina]